jgi:hypothetical protein
VLVVVGVVGWCLRLRVLVVVGVVGWCQVLRVLIAWGLLVVRLCAWVLLSA